MRFLFALVLLSGCLGKYIRPTTTEKIDPTPDRLARGKYLVDGPGACGVCHTTWKTEDVLSGEGDQYLAGGNYIEAKSQGYAFFVPNITPDPKTGVGEWSDDQLMRAIRDGIHQDDHLLMPFMPFPSYQHLSDDDVRAMVVYLRSIPPLVMNRPRKGNSMPGMNGVFLRNGTSHHVPVANVAPPAADPIARGAYMAQVAQCPACHALGERGEVKPSDPMFMAGSAFPLDRGLGKIWASNLTPDVETGIGRFKAEEIKKAIISGERLDGGKIGSPMAERAPHFAQMSAEDLDAIVEWLATLKPVKHSVPARELNEAGKKKLAP